MTSPFIHMVNRIPGPEEALKSMVGWFRRHKNGNPQGEPEQASQGISAGELYKEAPKETALSEVDAPLPKEKEPADGFSEAGIREALRDVRDPEIGRDLVSLNMVREVRMEGPSVTVGIALTTAGCPLKHRITTDVRDR